MKGSKTSTLLVTGTAANEKKWFKCLLESPEGQKEESREVCIVLV